MSFSFFFVTHTICTGVPPRECGVGPGRGKGAARGLCAAGLGCGGSGPTRGAGGARDRACQRQAKFIVVTVQH
eukprot:6354572-Prymnesium_polylepis.1